jgi:hypothetical protein
LKSNLLFFCFLFFFDPTSDDVDDLEFELEREAADDRVRFDCFLFFFVSLIGDTFDFEETVGLIGRDLVFDTGFSLN